MSDTIRVGDSEFIGSVKFISSKSDAIAYHDFVKKQHPSASHIPYSWVFVENDGTERSAGFDEDDEPPNSTGPVLLREVENMMNNMDEEEKDGGYGYILVVVRFFGTRLLGVTCGRLSQCYQSIAALTLHRYASKGLAFHQDFTKESSMKSNRYGMGAGDCELILNIVGDIEINDQLRTNEITPNVWVSRIVEELEFGGFRGHKTEVLPRLQNLQADISQGSIPAYRYPGNYRGDEWTTYQWSPLSLKVKQAVENYLLPLVDQKMNHCVTNFYRDGVDFIDHHSDKDLDLDKDGVIVSVSLGDERILELKRRSEPKDTVRMVLPHGSMLVLGPNTNKLFTHSILRKKDSQSQRLSLTLRHVVTFLDIETGRLFGEGVSTSSLKDARELNWKNDLYFVAGMGALVSSIIFGAGREGYRKTSLEKKALFSLSNSAISYVAYICYKKISLVQCKRKDENDARSFFSKASVNGTKY
mmetsp:Transcript_20016/g.30298  ORF Transcript_20016/g.30298 Transcript_20016/m.30298 type:complete len:472 (-) Transcript_20016:10-1425(-)